MVVSWVEPEIKAAVNRVISIAGSARKPISISRRAPRPPKEGPMSMAASAENTRASANTPTSAMMSAAGAKGRSVAGTGTMPAASRMQQEAGRRAVLQPGASLVDPAQEERRGEHHEHRLQDLERDSGEIAHRTKTSSAIRVMKL